jgi:hypothetical protein
MKTRISALALSLTILFVSCDQEYLNPSAASQTQVVNDVLGLITLANGLQFRYSVTRLSPNYTVTSTSGILTRELTVLNAGNTDEENLRLGGNNVIGSNGVITNLWNQSQLIRATADQILDNLSIVTDQGVKGGLQAHATIYKALALGNLAMFWESAPITTGINAPFVPRSEILAEAIRILEAASAELAKAALPATFTSRIVAGIDYANTLNVLIARYALMAGQYDKAIEAANRVSTAVSVRAVMNHDDASPNAMFFVAFSNRNVTEPPDALFSLPTALQTPAADRRLAFFFNATGGTGTVNRARSSFYTANGSAVPIYRPGEVALIRAEAHVRKSTPDLNSAVADLNLVLQKTAAQDALGIGAALPAYAGPLTSADLLTEIYRQRCIELYLSGMRLEDSRRFGRPVSERGRSFLPYPFSERDNNSNTPAADPAF